MNTSLAVEDTYLDIKERMSQIPDNYRRMAVSQVGTEVSIDPYQVFSQQLPKNQAAPLWKISSAKKKFYTPIPISVRIHREDNLFFAENENLAVCGTGDTPQEALKDMGLHIIHFFEYYKKIGPDQITGDAVRLKEVYKDLLIEE